MASPWSSSPCARRSRQSHTRFSAHALQLVLLLDVAPTLLALGAPLSLLLQAAPRRPRRLAERALGSRLGAVLTHPALVLGLVILSTYGYLLTPLYRVSLRHAALLGAVNAELLAVGCLFWWQAVSPDRLPNRMSDPLKLLFLGAVIPPGAFLGIDMLDSVHPLAAGNTVADTHIGGAVLWGFADLYTLGAIGIVFLRWMRAEERSERSIATPAFDAVEAAERIVAAAASSLVEHGDGAEDQDRP